MTRKLRIAIGSTITMAIFFMLSSLFVACKADPEKPESENVQEQANAETFSPTKWRVKEGRDYPFREQMLEELVQDTSIRALRGDKLFDLLGEPDRRNENYLYYQLDQTRLGPWPLHTKTLVIKLKADATIEWMKVHE